MTVWVDCPYAHNDGSYWAKVERLQEKIIVFWTMSKCVNSLDSSTQMNIFNGAGGRGVDKNLCQLELHVICSQGKRTKWCSTVT